MELTHGHIRIDYCPHPGSIIMNVSAEVTALAKKKDVIVDFVFDGVSLRAYPITEPGELMDKYQEAMALRGTPIHSGGLKYIKK